MARPEQKDVIYLLDDLIKQNGIPKEYTHYIWMRLVSEIRCADIIPSIKKKIKINQKGYERADKLETEIFDQTGISVFDNPVDMSIEETCKIIFDKHKEKGGFIEWTKQTFKPNAPKNLSTAKDIMFAKGLIIQSTTNSRKTILNPKVLSATSYEEAEKILEQEMQAPSVQQFFQAGRDIKKSGNIHSTFESDLPDRNPIANPATKNKNKLAAIAQKVGVWIISNIWTFILAVAATMLAAYLLVKFAIPH